MDITIVPDVSTQGETKIAGYSLTVTQWKYIQWDDRYTTPLRHEYFFRDLADALNFSQVLHAANKKNPDFNPDAVFVNPLDDGAPNFNVFRIVTFREVCSVLARNIEEALEIAANDEAPWATVSEESAVIEKAEEI